MHDNEGSTSNPVSPELSDKALHTETTSHIVGYRLRRAQLNVFQRFLAVFEEMGLRPAEYTVMVTVAENPGRKQTDIADTLGIKKANFVTLVHGLEARNLLERRPSAGDKRANALYLTGAGETFLAGARALHDEMETDIVNRLGGKKARDTLLSLLDRLT
jgi:DNA-binding MarR family transcriptional regulator